MLFLTSPAAAQRPLPSPPASPQFLSHYDFHLSAAALANADPRYSWDTHFGGAIDIVDYVYGRAATVLDYEAVLGNQLRPFDPNQGNYIVAGSWTTTFAGIEAGPTFYHQSRHLSDRPKDYPVDWNMLGGRVTKHISEGAGTVDLRVDLRRTIVVTTVDYEWELKYSKT